MTFDFVCDDCGTKLVVDIPEDLDPLLRFGREATFDRMVSDHLAECSGG